MIFDSCHIGGIDASCPVVRSATFEGRADADGYPTESLTTMYEGLVDGGVGLIITGMIASSPLEPYQHRQLRIDRDSCVGPLSAMIHRVHEKGGKIVAQIVVMGSGIVLPEGEDRIIISPSGVPEKQGRNFQQSQALTIEQIETLYTHIAAAARRAKDAGFDGVQFHSAHGYLASKFLTPAFNARTDEYGGSLENRARFLLSAIDAIKAAVGPDFPVWVKINCDDFMKEKDFTFDECKTVLGWLADHGVMAMEISGGNTASLPRKGPIRAIRRTKEPMYFKPFATEAATLLKGKADVGVVGGYRTAADIDDTLMNTDIAFVSMCRPFLRQPDLLNRWKGGSSEPATCISCSRCFGADEVDCIFHKEGKE